METPTPTLLSDLRARRLARRAIEAQDRLDAARHGRAPPEDTEVAALSADRDRAIARLERAAARLPSSLPLRRLLDESCRAHRALVSCPAGSANVGGCEGRFADALAALADAMRASDGPGASGALRRRHDACSAPDDRRSR